jgi:hypothetical protein
MDLPLSKSQSRLRGRKIVDMSVEQLQDWIAACRQMEEWKHTPAKARHDWKVSGSEAMTELERRQKSE